MQSLIMTIEDSFQIPGRGLVIVPAPLVSSLHGPANLKVSLHRPNGSKIEVEMLVTHHFLTPAPQEPRWGCILPSLQQHEVPNGTEVWSVST
jgi:hypothetical protein